MVAQRTRGTGTVCLCFNLEKKLKCIDLPLNLPPRENTMVKLIASPVETAARRTIYRRSAKTTAKQNIRRALNIKRFFPVVTGISDRLTIFMKARGTTINNEPTHYLHTIFKYACENMLMNTSDATVTVDEVLSFVLDYPIGTVLPTNRVPGIVYNMLQCE